MCLNVHILFFLAIVINFSKKLPVITAILNNYYLIALPLAKA